MWEEEEELTVPIDPREEPIFDEVNAAKEERAEAAAELGDPRMLLVLF